MKENLIYNSYSLYMESEKAMEIFRTFSTRSDILQGQALFRGVKKEKNKKTKKQKNKKTKKNMLYIKCE